ncbi:sigma-70 family RNA polymerase sigma factor [Kutzneria viridogrisea]
MVDENGPGQVWQLVRAAQSGDGAAFSELYAGYVDMVYRYVWFRVGDRALAEDLTSETFLRALRRITSVDYQGRDLGAWFMTIARNLVLDNAKSGRARLEISSADAGSDAVSHEGPEQAVLTRERSTVLLDCVRQLKHEQRECIVLRFLHGLSISETALRLGSTEGAVKALQHRAVRRLATLLPESYH